MPQPKISWAGQLQTKPSNSPDLLKIFPGIQERAISNVGIAFFQVRTSPDVTIYSHMQPSSSCHAAQHLALKISIGEEARTLLAWS